MPLRWFAEGSRTLPGNPQDRDLASVFEHLSARMTSIDLAATGLHRRT